MRILLIFVFFLFSCKQPLNFPQGGYEFPSGYTDADSNYYRYPIKNIVSKKDSLQISEYHFFYRPFNEPNISIKPLKKPVFRLVYSPALKNPIIIVVSEGQIIIKEGDPSIMYTEDSTKLNSVERTHLALLNRRYPIDTSGKGPLLKAYLDSMIKMYPQLLDVTYYKSLKEKALTINANQFEYSSKQLNISSTQYTAVIKAINSSGYWSMPHENYNCAATFDGEGYSLEANANSRYNIVVASWCPNDTTAFAKACQNIIDIAQLNKRIRLVSETSVDIIKVKH